MKHYGKKNDKWSWATIQMRGMNHDSFGKRNIKAHGERDHHYIHLMKRELIPTAITNLSLADELLVYEQDELI